MKNKNEISWFVVTCQDGVTAVPGTWLSSDNSTVCWPPKKVKKCMSKYTPDSSWVAHKVNLLHGPYDNKAQAIDVEIQLAYMSSSDENYRKVVPNPDMQNKRPKRPKRVSSSEEDESSVKLTKVKVPKPPWSFSKVERLLSSKNPKPTITKFEVIAPTERIPLRTLTCNNVVNEGPFRGSEESWGPSRKRAASRGNRNTGSNNSKRHQESRKPSRKRDESRVKSHIESNDSRERREPYSKRGESRGSRNTGSSDSRKHWNPSSKRDESRGSRNARSNDSREHQDPSSKRDESRGSRNAKSSDASVHRDPRSKRDEPRGSRNARSNDSREHQDPSSKRDESRGSMNARFSDSREHRDPSSKRDESRGSRNAKSSDASVHRDPSSKRDESRGSRNTGSSDSREYCNPSRKQDKSRGSRNARSSDSREDRDHSRKQDESRGSRNARSSDSREHRNSSSKQDESRGSRNTGPCETNDEILHKLLTDCEIGLRNVNSTTMHINGGTENTSLSTYVPEEYGSVEIQDRGQVQMPGMGVELTERTSSRDMCHYDCMCNDCRTLGRIKETLNIIHDKVNHIILVNEEDVQVRTLNSERNDNETLPKQPLGTVDELEKFNESIETNYLALEQFRRKVRRRGGKNAATAARAVMELVMTNSLAREYSWKGVKGNRKFQDKTMSNTIIDEILRSYPGCTVCEVEKSIGNWLRKAGDRIKAEISKTS